MLQLQACKTNPTWSVGEGSTEKNSAAGKSINPLPSSISFGKYAVVWDLSRVCTSDNFEKYWEFLSWNSDPENLWWKDLPLRDHPLPPSSSPHFTGMSVWSRWVVPCAFPDEVLRSRTGVRSERSLWRTWGPFCLHTGLIVICVSLGWNR